MNCPNCQAENRDDASFCHNCGHRLLITCPNCGEKSPPTARFCFNCGHKLISLDAPLDPPAKQASHVDPDAPLATRHSQTGSPPAKLQRFISPTMRSKLESARAAQQMEGERRIVTILFGDIAGSTAAAQQLDPEEWTEIMNGAFQQMIAPIYRYEGTVARLMGDAILAFFGAPIAHEDDPQRALLAALEIVGGIDQYRQEISRRHGVEFDVRVGINTGMVVVGTVGSDLALEYTAMGDAVNMASRMEQSAAPGTVQISADTHKLVAPLFDFSDLGAVAVKGISEPVRAYRVLGPKAVPGPLRGISGLASPLVGRDTQLHTLRGAIIRLRQGQGQIVSVIGEAGLGKSRLVSELRQAPTPVVAVQAPIHWIEGRSLSYETTTPYAPFIDLFTNHFDLTAGLADAEKYERISQGIAAVAPERVQEIAPFLAYMLGVQLSGEALERIRYLTGPPQVRELLFQAVYATIELLAADQPLVMIIDDGHWIDPTSLDLLLHLLPITGRAPLLLLLLFRPGSHALSWHFHELALREYGRFYTPVELAPLDGQDARQLVVNLLHMPDFPEELQAQILAKSDGNPFFLEEVIRSLLDDGLIRRDGDRWLAAGDITRIAVPDTLAGVITARLDRLDEGTRQVAQAAAVIGRRFAYETLVAVYGDHRSLEEALGQLGRRELIYERSRTPQLVYQFKHALTQETAYSSLLRRNRQGLHRRTADYLAENAVDRPAEIARHYLGAEEQGLALPYLVDAGEKAARTYATTEAINLFEQALTILESEPDLGLSRRAYEGLGGALTLTGEIQRTGDLYQAMLQEGRDGGDIPMQVSALNKLAFRAAFYEGEIELARDHLSQAERLAKPVDDLGGLTEVHTLRCGVCLLTGDFDGAMNHFDEAADIGVRAELEEPLLFGLTHSAQTLMSMTRYEEGWQKAQEAYEAAEKAGNRQYMAEVLATSYADYHVRNGDFAAVQRVCEEAIELAAPIGASVALYYANVRLAYIVRWQGDLQQAITYNQQAIEAGAAFGGPGTDLLPLCDLAALYLAVSPSYYQEHAAIQDRIQAISEHPAARANLSAAWMELGFISLHLGDPVQAADYFTRSLDHQDSQIFLVRPFLLTGQALVALIQGALPQAALKVAEAQAYVQEREMRVYYPLLTLMDARVHQARGELQNALALFNQAEEQASLMTMRPIIQSAQMETAELLTALNRADEAQEKREQARATTAAIAGLFTDDTLRQRYLDEG